MELKARLGVDYGPSSERWKPRKPKRHGADERRERQEKRPMKKDGGTQHDGGKPSGKGPRTPSPGGH